MQDYFCCCEAKCINHHDKISNFYCFDEKVFLCDNYSPQDNTTWELNPDYGEKYETNNSGGVIYFTSK